MLLHPKVTSHHTVGVSLGSLFGSDEVEVYVELKQWLGRAAARPLTKQDRFADLTCHGHNLILTCHAMVQLVRVEDWAGRVGEIDVELCVLLFLERPGV